MLINAHCIPCLTKMALNLATKASLNHDAAKKVFSEIMKIPGLRGEDWNITAVEIVELVMKILTEAVGQADPFKKEKEIQNRMVMDIHSFLQDLVTGSSDPLREAVKLAIFGNSIDFITAGERTDIKRVIQDRRDAPFSKKKYEQFLNKLKTAKQVLYIGDNSGEIVLDKLFIELLTKEFALDVVFVARSTPTMNDVTLEEARFVGMDEVVTVIENGIDGPLTGIIVERCSEEMRERMNRADLIISKGGGNFETLQEERNKIDTDISYLVVSKCQNYIDLFDVPIGDPILANDYRT